MSELPRLETYLYLFIWSSGVCVSLYHLFVVGKVFNHADHVQYHQEDFRKGWYFLGERYLDQADYEWNTWAALFKNLSPYLLVNFIGAEFIRWRKVKSTIQLLWYIIITISFLIIRFNISLTLWFVFQALIYLVIIYFRSHIFMWILSFVIICFLKPDMWFTKEYDDQYLIMVSSSWLVLRCISYSSPRIEELVKSGTQNSFRVNDAIDLLGYALYLPTMFCGPFMSYSHFNNAVKFSTSKWTMNRILKIIKNFGKCFFWYFFTLFALHYIYVNAILLRPHFVKLLLDWELAGLGIAMGHFFHLKYVVFYGLPCAWASAEGFPTPKLPCCVSRVHLYSYMWRNFDQGLYQFLVRYIYKPIISRTEGNLTTKKLIASVGCFAFMFAWHRTKYYVFCWVLFNYIAIVIELIAREFFSLPRVQNFLKKNMSPQNQLRLQCLLTAPLHCFSMISNYFFIGNGMDIGMVYVKRIFYGSSWNKLIIWFFLYGAGQSAVATQNWIKSKRD